MAIAPNSPREPPSEGGAPSSACTVDRAAWQRAGRRWSRMAEAPWLHAEVARRMAERLGLLRQPPTRILDWDGPRGASAAVLARVCPGARCLSRPTQDEAWWSRWRRALGGGAVPDLLWSNLTLHTEPEPDRLLAQWHDSLGAQGLLMFSTYGPDTLRELDGLWAERGWGPAHQPFVDMHDWGDALVRAGFADPVMDQETVRLTWSTPQAVLAELRTLGVNAHPLRLAGCRGRRWASALDDALRSLTQPDGRVALTFEIVYGHAVKPLPRSRVEPVSTVSLDDMRTLLQTPRRRQ